MGMKVKALSRIANGVDPDETARNEQSQLDLHCLEEVHVFVCTDERVHQNTDNFLHFSTKPCVVGTQQKHLCEALPVSTPTNLFLFIFF